MPKLDGTQIVERLQKRLEQLQTGEEVAAKDIRALLNDEQQAALDAAWEQQQQLRKQKRARTEDEQKSLGWKTKRELHIQAYEQAITQASGYELNALKKRMKDAEVRSARIYMDAWSKSVDEGKSGQQAQNFANNELTRAGLRRVDGREVSSISRRDKEVWAMEDALRKMLENGAEKEQGKE